MEKNFEKNTAIVIGCSDGIGLELVQRLCSLGYQVSGFSKSNSPFSHEFYNHITVDVTDDEYVQRLKAAINEEKSIDLCVYCAGIGELFAQNRLEFEVKVFDVNLMSAVKTTQIVLEKMLNQKKGHFIGLSSIADAVISKEAPSYAASKSGISKFWEGIALNLENSKLKVSNIRFGFVDTKMAKSNFKPFMLSPKGAVDIIIKTIAKPRIRVTKPFVMDVLARALNFKSKFKVLFEF